MHWLDAYFYPAIGAPILPVCMDYTIKRSAIGVVVRTTGDFEHDRVEIHRFYTPLKDKRPNGFGA